MKVRLGLEFQTKLKIQATAPPIIVLATKHLSKLRVNLLKIDKSGSLFWPAQENINGENFSLHYETMQGQS